MTLNKNMLSPAGFTFNIKKLPELNFFVQSVDFPGVNLGFAEQPNPFKKLPVYGDHYEFTGDLSIEFKVNEDMGNYIEVYEWLQGLAFPDNYGQFRRLQAGNGTGNGLESDAYLMILSSAMNPIIRIDFEDLFPITLSGIRLDSRDTSIDYITATVDFKFKRYTFTPV